MVHEGSLAKYHPHHAVQPQRCEEWCAATMAAWEVRYVGDYSMPFPAEEAALKGGCTAVAEFEEGCPTHSCIWVPRTSCVTLATALLCSFFATLPGFWQPLKPRALRPASSVNVVRLG
mmetsp:Transcript_71699/g.99600  ORF Transcript_71699/g.99600 Transcript_71699/m.99600 type:complete len:118 (+) Transcript_71699:2240-2593(+)